jgi:small-conductance mechanosensitive channel
MSMDKLVELKDRIVQLLNFTLFELGETSVTLWTLIYGLVLIALFVYLVGRLRRWIVKRLLVRVGMDVGAREATGTMVHYALLVVGFIIILQTIGIDLTILNVLAGTLGIGLGFGLQNIVNNFVSGLIILFEGPIKVGDRIEVGDVHGRVTRIGARSATILTNDNIAIIVPNLKFITDNVVNWSHSDEQVRFRVPVTVAADSDLRLVERLLLEAANEDADVLADPAPGVRLLGFGENGFNFELRAWSHSLIHRRGYLISKLNMAIAEKFAAHGIEIPNPQRDVYIRSRMTEATG